MDTIGKNILRELQRRVSTPSLAAELPAGHLLQLAQRYIDYLERQEREREEQKKEVDNRITVRDVVELDIPVETKVAFLTHHRNDLVRELQYVYEQIEELGVDTETLPPVPDLLREEVSEVPELRR